MHDLGARLKDGVELGAVFQDFPRPLEPCRHNESGTGTELPPIARPFSSTTRPRVRQQNSDSV